MDAAEQIAENILIDTSNNVIDQASATIMTSGWPDYHYLLNFSKFL